MWLRETISSFRSAADSVQCTSDALRDDSARVTDALTLAVDRVTELAPLHEEAEAAISEVKIAAQSATIALVIVGTVAVAALALATYAVVRKAANYG